MCTDTNPFVGKVAKNYDEIARISKGARRYQQTGQLLQWVSCDDGSVSVFNY